MLVLSASRSEGMTESGSASLRLTLATRRSSARLSYHRRLPYSAPAAAIRASIDGGAASAQLATPADAHFTSWWHPLQQLPEHLFGASSGSAPLFRLARGPLNCRSNPQLLRRRTQSHHPPLRRRRRAVTLTRAPLKSIHAVAALLRKRARSANESRTLSLRPPRPQPLTSQHPTPPPPPQLWLPSPQPACP